MAPSWSPTRSATAGQGTGQHGGVRETMSTASHALLGTTARAWQQNQRMHGRCCTTVLHGRTSSARHPTGHPMWMGTHGGYGSCNGGSPYHAHLGACHWEVVILSWAGKPSPNATPSVQMLHLFCWTVDACAVIRYRANLASIAHHHHHLAHHHRAPSAPPIPTARMASLHKHVATDSGPLSSEPIPAMVAFLFARTASTGAVKGVAGARVSAALGV